MESHMISVERILNYTRLQYKNDCDSKDVPPALWPREGSIIFQDISLSHCHLRYSNVPLNMTVSIKCGEKIGVFARNGAGKSSLAKAICHLPTSVKGQIFIDGMNVNSLNPTVVRSAVVVVSQTPFLFSGSLRLNLDPKNIYSDKQVWKVLDQVQLRDVLKKRAGKGNELLLQVTGNGANFSMGEMQLICLARGLLQDSKIFVFDQVTSCLDPEKIKAIQDVLHEELFDRTVLVNSPPLNTWMDYDNIIVLDNGHIVDFGEPQTLLERKQSIQFRELQVS